MNPPAIADAAAAVEVAGIQPADVPAVIKIVPVSGGRLLLCSLVATACTHSHRTHSFDAQPRAARVAREV